MGKKVLNARCPLQVECERKSCEYIHRELECPYYSVNARKDYYIEDQEEIRRKQYREMEEAEFREYMERPRTIKDITEEILEAKRDGGEAILTIGRCLIEAKDKLRHGEWLPWLNEQVELSERTAQKFMQLAREWSNPNTLADLGASKALMLLALPADERESFTEEHDVIEMSARQLRQAIRERDEARAAAEQAKADRVTAETARAKMEEDMQVANASIEAAHAERERADDHVRRLEAELEELRSRPVDVAVETVVDQEAIDKARAEAVAGMQDKLDRAKAAKEKAEEKRKAAEEALASAQDKLERLRKEEKRSELSSDKDLAQFELLFGQGQEIVNKMYGILLRVKTRDEDAAGRLSKALRALADAVGRCAE